MNLAQQAMSVTNRIKKLSYLYLFEIWSSEKHTASFKATRSQYLSVRVSMLSMVWGTLVLLWIPIDLLFLSADIGPSIALARFSLGTILMAIAYKSRDTTTLKGALNYLYLLIVCVNLFYVYSMWMLGFPGQINGILYGYHLLPIIHVAMLTIFPITIRESLTLMAITAVTQVSVDHISGILFSPENLANYWLQNLVAAMVIWSQLSKLRMMMQMYRQATLDPLTGIYNRRQILTLAQRTFERCHREGAPFTVMLLDIDKFKRVNDTWGHSSGDKVLQSFTDFTQENLRVTDLFGRYGGEEFVIFVPHTPKEHIPMLAKRLLTGLEKLDIHLPHTNKTINITTSIGISYSEPGDTLSSLIERADSALYQCKNGGRNCFKVAELSVADNKELSGKNVLPFQLPLNNARLR
ncbi:GGDEF domain-containing protein [Vibrio sp. Of7-15]|uniref:GGDEF domain-containing protein n=1 Tax=Vibrio sp. Of7-15 TaxID=2724879 RepID=UPI001EF3AA48|nr:GGDEF domain-containing protein [Vibrio sp. Of7-15]MCG7497014.1 GGDEF domain-containing protein [Vibrio sp. Of7-15]